MRRWAILVALLLLAGCGAQHARHVSKLYSGPVIQRYGSIPQQHSLMVRYGGASVLAVGQSLYASNGFWANLSSSFTYQWKDCDTAGANCVNAAGSPSTNRVYTLVAGDAGDTIRVAVTGNNGGTQTSPQTGVVSNGSGGFFGNQTVGGTANGGMGADFKRVTSATTGITGELTKVTMYLSPTGTAGTQTLRNVIYSNSTGNPNSFLGISDEISFSQANAAGWYDLVLPDSVAVTSGLTYWLGMITGPTDNVIQFNYDSVGAVTTWELSANTYANGPSDPFGSSSNSQPWQMSVYATVAPVGSPVNTVRPTLSGTVSVGNTLTSTTGTWSPTATSFGYQWQDCDSTGINCQYIGGATSSSYTLAAGDVGHTIRSVVLASNATGAASRTSAVSSVVAGSAPGNTVLPSVTGTTTQGQTLSISNGTWTGSPTSYTYQWRDCDSGGGSCANATGTGNSCSNSGTGCNYTLTSGDVGSTMRVIVTATNGSGSTPATSPQSAVVIGTSSPVNTALPVVSGTTTVGSTLSTTNGTWTSGGSTVTCGGGTITCTYKWQRCSPSCVDITSATSSTYLLVSADSGSTIDAVVTATNGSGSTPAISAQTATIIGGGSSAPAYSPPACTSTVTTSTWIAAITGAASPATICLSTGTYSANEWVQLDKASTGGGVVVRPAPSATVSLGRITLTGAHNVTFEGFGADGRSSTEGLTMQGQFNSDLDTNITWEFNNHPDGGVAIATDPGANLGVTITNNHFHGNVGACEECNVRIFQDATCTSPSGITLSYNVWSSQTSQADALKLDGNDCAVQLLHNEFDGPNESYCSAQPSNIHCDAIQDDGGDRGTGTVDTGNYFHGGDGTGYILHDSPGQQGPDIMTGNVFAGGSSASCQEGTYDVGSTYNHNTWDCANAQGVDFYAASGTGNFSQNIGMTNNVFRSDGFVQWNGPGPGWSWATGSPDYNLHSTGAYTAAGNPSNTGVGGHDIINTPTFSGGASPSTWAGYALTAPSGALTGASDGSAMGANVASLPTPGPSW